MLLPEYGPGGTVIFASEMFYDRKMESRDTVAAASRGEVMIIGGQP